MAFKLAHFQALADKVGVDVAKELNKLHEAVFPGKNAPKEPEPEPEKTEEDDDE
jgi:hypothetical protein